MTEYVYNDANGTLASAKHSEGRTLLTLITADEFRAMKDSFPHHKEMLRSLGSVTVRRKHTATTFGVLCASQTKTRRGCRRSACSFT